MKIVDTDNFGGDYPDEQVIAESITNEFLGNEMVKALNNDPNNSRYYKLVPDDYKLQPGFEP